MFIKFHINLFNTPASLNNFIKLPFLVTEAFSIKVSIRAPFIRELEFIDLIPRYRKHLACAVKQTKSFTYFY
ncbi:hypothetical protein IX49_15705 [Cellulophaga lytica]|nr:hypothetical protein IX49_15705 [Cellulophaga lytica]